MPRPSKGESEQDFVSRYMGDPESRKKYPDQDQRSAIAYSIYRQHRGVSKMSYGMDLSGEMVLGEVEKGGPGSGRHGEGGSHHYDTEGVRIKVGDRVRHEKTGNMGTVAHLAAGPKGDKVGVDYDNPVQAMLGTMPEKADNLKIMI